MESNNSSSSITKAVILAGGKGERLRPYTNDRPKPMVEINGKPILQYQIEKLISVGVTEIVLTCSYLHEVIQDYFKDGSEFGVKIVYSIEESPLGRGGGMKQGMGYLSDEWENVIAMNGDIMWKGNLQELIDQHLKENSEVTMVVTPLVSPYGIVDFNEEGEVLGFREKPVLDYWLNSGIYIFNKSVKEKLPDVGDPEYETFPFLQKEKFKVYKTTEWWRSVDTVKDLKETSEAFA